MYIDFLVKPETPAKPETSEIRPTKISLIIQLMGLLNTLLPNRELFSAVVKLVFYESVIPCAEERMLDSERGDQTVMDRTGGAIEEASSSTSQNRTLENCIWFLVYTFYIPN